MGEYSDYPSADYAEVSSLKQAPSEYSNVRTPAQPSPYAYASITNAQGQGSKFVFCPADIYPNNSDNDSYSRNVYSESYLNPNEKDNLVHNRVMNTIDQIRPPYRLHPGRHKVPPENLYIKVGEIGEKSGGIGASSTSTIHSHSNSSSLARQNFNIYENHLHNLGSENPPHIKKDLIFASNVVQNMHPEHV
jgi:hypothetical protein